jgi:uncharacterized protein (DUF433 family)
MAGGVAIQHPRERIEVDPERLSGQPVVRNRRVSTETVADLAQRPEGLALLKEDYGLTEEEIREAVEYERDVDEALAAGRGGSSSTPTCRGGLPRTCFAGLPQRHIAAPARRRGHERPTAAQVDSQQA